MLIEICQILLLSILTCRFVIKPLICLKKLVKVLICLNSHRHGYAEVQAEPKALQDWICTGLHVPAIALPSQPRAAVWAVCKTAIWFM